jgi:hypothetical protein
VQRVWLHPGQQQCITDFIGSNKLDPGFRRGDEAFFNKLLAYQECPAVPVQFLCRQQKHAVVPG